MDKENTPHKNKMDKENTPHKACVKSEREIKVEEGFHFSISKHYMMQPHEGIFSLSIHFFPECTCQYMHKYFQMPPIVNNGKARVSNHARVNNVENSTYQLWPCSWFPWPYICYLWPWPQWPRSRTLISHFDLGHLDLWPLTLTLTLVTFSDSQQKNTIFMFDIELWPKTFSLDPILAKVKVNLHSKIQGHRSKCLAVRVHMDRQTNKTNTHIGPIVKKGLWWDCFRVPLIHGLKILGYVSTISEHLNPISKTHRGLDNKFQYVASWGTLRFCGQHGQTLTFIDIGINVILPSFSSKVHNLHIVGAVLENAIIC